MSALRRRARYAALHWTSGRLRSGKCGDAVEVLRGSRRLGLSVRQTKRYPRHCRWQVVVDMRGELAAYQARPHVVRPAKGRPRVAAAASLRDLVLPWLELARATGAFKMLSSAEIPMILCPYATPLWRASSTQCDVYVGCWKGGFAAEGQPHHWATWRVMDGGNYTHPLRAIDATASLNDQVQAVESALDIIVPGHGVARFRCHLTGDGKGMASMNHAPSKTCRCCDDGSSLQLANVVPPTPQWVAFLHCVPPHRQVGDYAHALACICNAVRKRLSVNVSVWVANGDGPGSVGRLKELWVEFTQEVARIPVSQRTGMRPTKAGQFDITLSQLFLTQPLWQRRPIRNKVRRYVALSKKKEGK